MNFASDVEEMTAAAVSLDVIT